MTDSQQNLTPVPPTPTKPNDNSKSIIGTILALVGFIVFGLPLGIAALVLGIIDNPKTPWSWTAIVIGTVDIVAVLAYLSY
jgi:hypothetical protein